MTRQQADTAAAMFQPFGFSRIEVSEFGFMTGNWEVYLWSINPSAGNRNLETVRHVPASEKEVKLIVKKAKKTATARDTAALSRIAAERTAD